MKNLSKKLKAAVAVAAAATTAAAFPLTNASAKQVLAGYRGDINHDMEVNSSDLVLLSQHIIRMNPISEDCAINADLNADSLVDVYDMIWLRQCLTGERELIGIYNEIPDEKADFISPSIEAVDASLPSQNNANLVVFYVDFPDCKYSYEPSAELISQSAFGEADTSSPYYPYESMHAFYERSSKGTMNLGGQVFRYTTKENQAAYDTNKVKLAEECYDAFKDSVDFSQFDGDGDGMIDATLFTVPTAAGDTDWWPCAGGFGDPYYRVDGMAIGHIITGNAQIESAADTRNFVTSYLHEMGHCMGLPDYYLYSSDDYEGFHGSAGSELMDTDASMDFCAFSKLMLGWYRENQISVYDSSAGTQTFTLSNAQTEDGNCVIIPYGTLDDRYFSEYFIIEYATNDGNNCSPPWYIQKGSGIRIHHVKADLQEDYWWTYLKYQNGSEYTNGDDAGIRLIRIVNDTEGDNFFYTGDIIDSSVSGFGWYDSSENESIDPGVTISIGECTDGEYSITVSNK